MKIITILFCTLLTCKAFAAYDEGKSKAYWLGYDHAIKTVKCINEGNLNQKQCINKIASENKQELKDAGVLNDSE